MLRHNQLMQQVKNNFESIPEKPDAGAHDFKACSDWVERRTGGNQIPLLHFQFTTEQSLAKDGSIAGSVSIPLVSTSLRRLPVPQLVSVKFDSINSANSWNTLNRHEESAAESGV